MGKRHVLGSAVIGLATRGWSRNPSQVAAGTLSQRNRDALLGYDPANIGQSAVGERLDLAFSEVCRRPQVADQVVLIMPAGKKVELLKNFTAGRHPFAFGLEFPGLDEWLRSDAIQKIPVAFRLAIGHINGVRANVFDRSAVVFHFREMAGGEFLARDWELPAFETLFVPYARHARLCHENRCRSEEHTSELQSHSFISYA